VSHVTETLDDVTDQKWRHRPIWTTVSYWCSIHKTCVRCTVWKFYPVFWLSIMAECRSRSLGGVWHRKWGHQSIERPSVFYSCFVDIYRLSSTASTLLALFLLPKMVERRFRPLGGVLNRKWRYRSIPWPRFGTGWFWNFASISHRWKVIRLFRSSCKMPFENSGEGVLPIEKNIFIGETLKRHFLVANDVVWGISLANRPARFGGGSWQEVKK
jgi:hypothetical protein